MQLEQKTFNLVVHSQAHSNDEIILQKDLFEEYLAIPHGDQVLIEVKFNHKSIVLYINNN